MMNIEISLTGNNLNGWPLVRIALNNKQLYDGEVIDQCVIIHLEDKPQESNTLTIEHYGKNNDTEIDNNGNIIADRYFNIDSVKIDNLQLDEIFFSEYNVVFKTEHGQEKIGTYIGENGILTLNFAYPLWKLWGNMQKTLIKQQDTAGKKRLTFFKNPL
jgi:hypothetical protein